MYCPYKPAIGPLQFLCLAFWLLLHILVPCHLQSYQDSLLPENAIESWHFKTKYVKNKVYNESHNIAMSKEDTLTKFTVSAKSSRNCSIIATCCRVMHICTLHIHQKESHKSVHK